MDGGSLNLRNDEVFDKLDSAPRKDVNKLIQLQKETNANNIAKQRRDSLNAIEESLFKLDIFEDATSTFTKGKENENNKQKHENTVFESIVNNLRSDNDSFLKKIETLYNILFKSYKSELIIRKKLGNYDGSINDVDEYVQNRILGRIIFNIEYFRNFTKEYEKYDFEDVINKIKRIPESSMSQEQDRIRVEVEKLLKRSSDTNYTDTEIDQLIKLIIGEKSGGAPNNITTQLTEKLILKEQEEEGEDETEKEVAKQTIQATTSSAILTQDPKAEEEDTSNYTQLTEKLILKEQEGEDGDEGGGGGGEEEGEEDLYNNNIQLIQEFTSNPNTVNIPYLPLNLPNAGSGIVPGSIDYTPKHPTNPIFPIDSSFSSGTDSETDSETDSKTGENKTEDTSNNKQLTQEIKDIITKYKNRLSNIDDEIVESCINNGVELIMRILYKFGLIKNKKELTGEGGSPEKTEESNLFEYIRRAGENAILVLTKDTKIKEKDAKEAIINLILTQQYLFRNLTNKVNFYVLEVFYGIIYGTLLNYDLILKDENKYIIERVENLSQVYSIINDIIYDQTYRTLKQLYNKKYPGFRNIFRIDSLYNDVFTRSETNKTEKGSFTEEKEYSLRDLVILKINNGAVDIKDFQKLLNIMYEKNEYQDLYKFLHEISNIYNLGKEIKVLNEAGYDKVADQKTEELNQQIDKLKPELDKLKPELDKLKPELDKLKPELDLDKLETTPKELETQLNILKTKASKIIGDSNTTIDSPVNLPNGTAGTAGTENKTDDDLYKVIAKILELELPSENSTPTKDKFSKLFSDYINKKMGGTNIDHINIKTPVSGYDEPTLNVKKCKSSIVEPMTRITKQLGGKLGGSFEEDYEKIKIKKEELKAKLENPTVDDDITESITDNAKRKLNKVKNNIKQFFNTKENVEEDIPKVLDEEYLNALKEFNINDVKTQSYKELRKNLYRIKNNEYFEDIKITNEDIYTFIATTYVLRVISLYITMWFIQIEIVKDVESVIVSYILTYILLFILIYTFVNLSDNQLDTSKSFLYYFYSRVNFSYTRFIVHLGLLLLLIIIPFVIRTIDKESASYKHISDTEKRYLYTFITNMSTIVWVILSIIAFFFK